MTAATKQRTNFSQECRPTHIERHPGGAMFPPHYTVQFTCGHPSVFFAPPRAAAGIFFRRIGECRECTWGRAV